MFMWSMSASAAPSLAALGVVSGRMSLGGLWSDVSVRPKRSLQGEQWVFGRMQLLS